MNVLKFSISYLIILIQFSYNNVICNPAFDESDVQHSPKSVFSPKVTKSLKERLNHYGSLAPSPSYKPNATDTDTEKLSKEEVTQREEEDTKVKEQGNNHNEENPNVEENLVTEHHQEDLGGQKLNEAENTVSELNEDLGGENPNLEETLVTEHRHVYLGGERPNQPDPADIANVPYDTSSTDLPSHKEEEPQVHEEEIKEVKVDNLEETLTPQEHPSPTEPKTNPKPKDKQYSFTDIDGSMFSNLEELKKCTETPHDFVVMLDESDSISNYNWKRYVKQFTTLIATAISQLNQDNTLSVLHYSDVPTLAINTQKIDPNSFKTTEDKIKQIFERRRSYGNNYTGKALEYVRKELFHLPEIAEGSSSDSPDTSNKVVILVTDGAAKDIEKAYYESLTLRYNRVELFVFGVGFVQEEECRKLVGCPSEGLCYNFFYASWNSVAQHLQELVDSMCRDLGRNATCKELWSEFSECSRPCGGGTKKATLLRYTTLTEATAGSDGKKGLSCDEQYKYMSEKVVRCNEHPCPPDQTTLFGDLINPKNGLSADTDMLTEVKRHLRDDNTVDTHMRTKNLGDTVHRRHHSHTYSSRRVPERRERKPDPVGTKILNDLLDDKKEPETLPFQLLGENEHHVQVERILDQSEVDTPVRKHTQTSPVRHPTYQTTPPPSPPTHSDSDSSTDSDSVSTTDSDSSSGPSLESVPSSFNHHETPTKVDREVQTRNLVDQGIQTDPEKVDSTSQTESNKQDGNSQTDRHTSQELATLTYDKLKQLVHGEHGANTKREATEQNSNVLEDAVREGVNKVDQHLKETMQQLQGGRWKSFVLKFKQKFKQLLENENFKKLSAVLIVIILSAISISFFSYLFLREREPVRRLFDPNDQEFMNAGDGDDVEPSENYQVSNMEDGIWA
ncbi:cell surface/extracellular protein, putative [Theileria annulata]|uniref:Cell surface/extracellular protein, putative n=1 Tax=Theileria annulata TaxID=5874 RepID=Q464T6_THEAN|nr:cell surface/extracellular protein, putative [Theileria annulata]CAJ20068.1 cell surface/extracellular protein, putative [Theileria annulata]|eukprot:XP_952976.1 cell surface/extracellular protein, putative [Theileria annulata]